MLCTRIADEIAELELRRRSDDGKIFIVKARRYWVGTGVMRYDASATATNISVVYLNSYAVQ